MSNNKLCVLSHVKHHAAALFGLEKLKHKFISAFLQHLSCASIRCENLWHDPAFLTLVFFWLQSFPTFVENVFMSRAGLWCHHRTPSLQEPGKQRTPSAPTRRLPNAVIFFESCISTTNPATGGVVHNFHAEGLKKGILQQVEIVCL